MAGCQHKVTVLVNHRLIEDLTVVAADRSVFGHAMSAKMILAESNCELCGADIEIEFIRYVGEEVKHATN